MYKTTIPLPSTNLTQVDSLLSSRVDRYTLLRDHTTDQFRWCNIETGVVDFLPFFTSRSDSVRSDLDDDLFAGERI
jgi:hypothetical protein